MMFLKRYFPLVLLVLYAAALFKVLVLKDMPDIHIGHLRFNFGGTHEGPPNLVPFRTIWPYLRGDGGWIIGGMNLAGNIGLLVPIGFLLPFVFAGMNGKKALVWAIASGLVIESSQVLLHVGIFDIDDVILNGIGVMIGYWVQGLFVRMFRTDISRVIALAVVLLIMLGAVYAVVIALRGGRAPQVPRPDVHVDLPDSGAVKEGAIAKLPDPCGGTGGTGRIVSVGAQEITIRGRDGGDQVIHLTASTKISSASGTVTFKELKPGEGVTIVTTDDSGRDHMVAAVVLICGADVK